MTLRVVGLFERDLMTNNIKSGYRAIIEEMM
jgi:hypothetical protein